MKKFKKIIIPLAGLAIIAIAIVVIAIKKNEDTNISYLDKNNPETINEIKQEINSTADNDIYEIIEEEYTGREILQIKPNIQFQTALAGILKNDIPQEQEIDELLKKSPTKTGIWISEQSRDKFIKLLKDNEINVFEINKEGYVIQKEESDNNNAKLIKNAIKSNKLYILDFSGLYYIRDYLSGLITKEQFEEMDPNQILQVISSEDKHILEITSNSKGNLSSNEILEDILLNME